MMTMNDIEVHIPLEVRRLNALAKACSNAKDNDMKAMWYHKLIDLAKQYKMMDYVTRKLMH
jgi:hypothetical protein